MPIFWTTNDLIYSKSSPLTQNRPSHTLAGTHVPMNQFKSVQCSILLPCFSILLPCFSILLSCFSIIFASEASETTFENSGKRNVAGWTLHIAEKLLIDEPELTARAVELLEAQLQEIIRVVPGTAVAELKKVPLYFSPEYPGKRPAAEFHPGADWLIKNGRDPGMVKAIEFTNIRIFEAETRRMPNFALHELAHAFHNLVLTAGFGNAEIIAAFERAKASGIYDKVERRDSEGRIRTERAYAMATAMEYFAETTEAYFTRNDFFPFTNEELQQHDPGMFALLTTLWQVNPPG
ncbi:MAG TPA: hypothetical protein VM260_27510 [Pirellula sp.]|nr:hypothetical protein [Pirellula sp.]